MGSRWQLRVPRAEDEREHNPVRGVIHNIHRIKPPLPRTPSPFYRHLFLRGRGRATITEVHLNLPPGLTPQPGSPQPALLASPTLTVDTIPRFRPNQSSSKGGPNLPLLTSIEMTPDASAVVTFHRIHWKGSPESASNRHPSSSTTCSPDHRQHRHQETRAPQRHLPPPRPPRLRAHRRQGRQPRRRRSNEGLPRLSQAVRQYN